MSSSDPLFLLIKAMSRSEKGYFRLNRARHTSGGNKHYMRLFDALEKQKEYDEVALRTKFKGERYFSQLNYVKMYLHRQILKCLQNFYYGTSSDLRMNNYLAEIEILYKKQLLRNCAATIQKAKVYAEKFEKFPQLLQLIEWEIKLSEYAEKTYSDCKWRKSIIGKAKETIKAYHEIFDLKEIDLEVRLLFLKTGRPKTLDEEKAFDKIFNHPLVEQESNIFRIEFIRLSQKSNYERIRKSGKGNSYEVVDKLTRLFELHPHHLDENINIYLDHLLEKTISLINANKLNSAIIFFEKPKLLFRDKGDKLIPYNKIRLLGIEIYLLLQQGDFKKALQLIPQMDDLKGRRKSESALESELYIYSLYIDIYFCNGDFRSAQHYVQKVINFEHAMRLDIQASARLINLILQYEQRELEHLGYIIRSTYRYLAKNKRLSKSENIVLGFLRKAAKLASEKQVLYALAEFKQQILPLVREIMIFNFPLVEWIDSKTQKRALSEIVKEKYLSVVAAEQLEPVLINMQQLP